MGTINERYKYSVKDYKKFNIWILVLNVISLLIMVFAIFVPYNKLSTDKFFKNSFENLHEIVRQNGKSFDEKKSKEIANSLTFAYCLILDTKYYPEKSDTDTQDLSENKDEVKCSIIRYMFQGLLKSLVLIEDDEIFNKQLNEFIKENVTYQERKVSVFDLVVQTMPETSVAHMFKENSNIFGLDAYGNFLVSIPFFIIFLCISIALSFSYILISIICLVNPDAATRRYFKNCVGEDGKKQCSQLEIKQQGQYFFPWYIFAYIIALLIALLPRSGKVFAKNISSCIPFVSLTVSPFAYVLVAIEAVIFILSLVVNSMKRNIRSRL